MEYGIAIRQGDASLRRALADLSTLKEGTDLTDYAETIFTDLYQEFVLLEGRVNEYTKKILLIAKSNDYCQQLTTIPGVGPLIATALVSSEYVLKKGANRRSFLYHSERNVHALRGGNNINDSGNVVDGVESGPISSHTNGVGGNSEAEILTLFNSLRQRLEGDGADSTAGMRREVHLLDPSI